MKKIYFLKNELNNKELNIIGPYKTKEGKIYEEDKKSVIDDIRKNLEDEDKFYNEDDEYARNEGWGVKDFKLSNLKWDNEDLIKRRHRVRSEFDNNVQWNFHGLFDRKYKRNSNQLNKKVPINENYEYNYDKERIKLNEKETNDKALISELVTIKPDKEELLNKKIKENKIISANIII